MTTPRSRIAEARLYEFIRHLERPWQAAGPRDIVVVGDLDQIRLTLAAAGIPATMRTRMHVSFLKARTVRTVIGARISIRRAGDVARAVEIAADLGGLVTDDADAGETRRK